MKRIVCMVFIVFLTLGATFFTLPAKADAEPAFSSETVIFTDTVLEAKIRTILDKPIGDITIAEAKKVRSLDLSNEIHQTHSDDTIIKDIDALRYFTNLRELRLRFNAIEDISPLAELKQLRLLDLYSNNNISDISPLRGLTNLFSLNLQYNQIRDISPLSELKDLNVLLLKGNAIIDYRSLKAIYPNLKEKDFEIITAENVPDEPIRFADLNLASAIYKALGIRNGFITQRDAFQVQTLNLQHDTSSDEAFSNLSGLEYFVNLAELSLEGNKVSDLTPISGLTRMKSLVIACNEISDLSTLSEMQQLEKLDAKNNRISDVNPLGKLTTIWELQLNGNQITDISPLASLTKIKALFLGTNPITDFSPLKGIYPNLEDKDFTLE